MRCIANDKLVSHAFSSPCSSLPVPTPHPMLPASFFFIGTSPLLATNQCLFMNPTVLQHTEQSTTHQQSIHPSSILLPDNRGELEFDCSHLVKFFNENWIIPFATVTFYVIAVFAGKAYMNDCKPWAWRSQLAAWNLFLSVFSTVGFLRTFPHLVHNYATMSLRDNFCVNARNTCGGGSTSLWIFLFSISKFPYVQYLRLLGVFEMAECHDGCHWTSELVYCIQTQ